MSIVVHHPLPPNYLGLNPRSILPHGPKPHAMSDDAKFRDGSCLWDERGMKVYSTLHDTLRKVGVWLGLPAVMLQTATDDGAATCCALHNVQGFLVTVVGTAGGVHGVGLVPDQDDLTTPRIDGRVHDAAQGRGHETSAVDHDGCVA